MADRKRRATNLHKLQTKGLNYEYSKEYQQTVRGMIVRLFDEAC